MNQSYNQLFDEKDLIEDNILQKVYKGSKKNTPHQRVIIHKFKKSTKFNTAFKDLLDSVIQNKLYVEENDEEIILVNTSIEGDNISLHLNFSSVNDEERVHFLYDYLQQATAYIGLENYIFNILISSNQVVFVDNQLHLKEHLVLDTRLNENIPFSIIAKNMGQVMQRILMTNYSELRTSKKYDELYQFTESLIRREKQYECFDDLFTDFKKIYFDKVTSRRKVLIGDFHPNNMFLNEDIVEEQEPVEEVVQRIVQNDTQKIRKEHPKVYETTLEDILNELDTSRPTFTYDFEEETNEEEYKNEPLPTLEVTEEERAVLMAPIDETPSEKPTYGVPSYFKEDPVEERPKKKLRVDFRIPIVAAFVCMVMIFSILWIPPLFTSANDTPTPPEARFSLEVQGDKIFCTNESIAYNDEIIVESFWVILKDGKEIHSEPGANKANFEVTGIEDGKYQIKLTVTDSANRFSDPFIIEKEYQSPVNKALDNQQETEESLNETQKFANAETSEELLDGFPISSTTNVTEDFSIFHEGNRSYKIDLGKNDGSASISFDSVDIPAKSTISFWMMTNKSEPITLTIIGYNDGVNNLTKELITNKGSVLTWNIVSMQLNLEEPTDRLVLRFNAEDTVLWFDDFSVRSFK